MSSRHSVEFSSIDTRLLLLAVLVDKDSDKRHKRNIDKNSNDDKGNLCKVVVLVFSNLTIFDLFFRGFELLDCFVKLVGDNGCGELGAGHG